MGTHSFQSAVLLSVPREVAFDYLADPRNRPQWQASLLSVSVPDHRLLREPKVGLAWRETTVAMVRPRMEITVLERPRRWAEIGRWGGVTGTLELAFHEAGGGCRIDATGNLSGRGPWAVAARAAHLLASRAVAADLRRAGRVLSEGTAR